MNGLTLLLVNQHPKLTVLYEDDKAVDATLSPGAIKALKILAEKYGVSLALDDQAPYEESEETELENQTPSRKGSAVGT